MKPTKDQINAEITALEEYKKTSPTKDRVYHDSDIDRQIECLRGIITEDVFIGDKLEKTFPRKDEREAIIDAYEWLDGDDPTPMSKRYKKVDTIQSL